MAKWIIIKYRDQLPEDAKIHENWSVYGSYTANQCGIETKTYNSQEDAQSDLKKMRDYNSAVYYGLIEVDNNVD